MHVSHNRQGHQLVQVLIKCLKYLSESEFSYILFLVLIFLKQGSNYSLARGKLLLYLTERLCIVFLN